MVIGLVLQIVVEAVLAFLFWRGGITQLAGERGTSPVNIANAYVVVAYGLSALSILTFIALAFWLWRSVDNADEAGAHMNYGPGWAIGWWLIPLANLWKPFDMLCELYSASQAPQAWSVEKRPGLVILWWLVHIAAIVLAMVVRFAVMSGTVDISTPSACMYTVGAIRLVLLLAIILRINGFQKRLQTRPGVERLF